MGMFAFGQAVPREEDPRLLRGRGDYIADKNAPEQTYAVLLRSPHAHARIVSIDAVSARTMPGVVAVFTDTAIWNGFMGPANMPAQIVNRLNAEMLKALQLPDTRAKLDATELIGGTPQEFGNYVRNEIESFGKLVKLLGLKPE